FLAGQGPTEALRIDRKARRRGWRLEDDACSSMGRLCMSSAAARLELGSPGASAYGTRATTRRLSSMWQPPLMLLRFRSAPPGPAEANYFGDAGKRYVRHEEFGFARFCA